MTPSAVRAPPSTRFGRYQIGCTLSVHDEKGPPVRAALRSLGLWVVCQRSTSSCARYCEGSTGVEDLNDGPRLTNWMV